MRKQVFKNGILFFVTTFITLSSSFVGWASVLLVDGTGELSRGTKDERTTWTCQDYEINNVPVWLMPQEDYFCINPIKNPGISDELNFNIAYVFYSEGQWNWDSLNGNEANLDKTGYSKIRLGKNYNLLEIWNQSVACARENNWYDPSSGINKISDVIFILYFWDDAGSEMDPIYIKLIDNPVQSSRITEGWKQDSSGWWYQNADGSYPTTWANINNVWYLFGGDGYMKTGWQLDNNKWYYMDETGAMLHDTTTPDGYSVGPDGALK